MLRNVSAGIAAVIRKSDCLARYGGEEFCCLLPETELNNAVMVAEHFRRQVEKMRMSYQSAEVRVTISLGVSEFCESDTPEKLLKRADQALYEAKRTGRNKVATLQNYPRANPAIASVARMENRTTADERRPSRVPMMLAGHPGDRRPILAFKVAPGWFAAGVAGGVVTAAWQRKTRGD